MRGNSSYDPALNKDDTIDVMVLMDRSAVDTSGPQGSLPDVLDQFAFALTETLQVGENKATLLAEVDELRDENDYPNNVYGVVTNVAEAARWTKGWGGNLVTVERLGPGSLRLTGRDSRTFDSSQLQDAVTFASDELDALPDDAPSVGLTIVEHRQLEVVLGKAERALHEVSLNPEDRALLQAAVETLRSQLSSPEPDRHIVGRVLRRFGAVGGGVLIGVLGNYMADLLRHFHVPWP